jgi:hypothetical protein
VWGKTPHLLLKGEGVNKNLSALILRKLCAITFLLKAVWRQGDRKWLVWVYIRDKRLAFELNFVFGRLHYASIFVSKLCVVDFVTNFGICSGTGG